MEREACICLYYTLSTSKVRLGRSFTVPLGSSVRGRSRVEIVTAEGQSPSFLHRVSVFLSP